MIYVDPYTMGLMQQYGAKAIVIFNSQLNAFTLNGVRVVKWEDLNVHSDSRIAGMFKVRFSLWDR